MKPNKVVKTRRLEIDFFKRLKVYTKVPRAMAIAMQKQVIATRWIDINKGDSLHEDYRSRLVAKQFKNKNNTTGDMFAATPLVEMLRVLFSRSVSIDRGGENNARRRCIMVSDINRAYLYAPVRSEIFIELPDGNSD